MIITENKDYEQILINPNGKINFQDKDLSAYIFLKTQLPLINLSKELICNVFSYELTVDFANIYLNFLKQKEKEVFDELNTKDGFHLDAVLDSLCEKINTDFATYSGLLFVVESKLEANYKEKYKNTNCKNPLDEVLENPFVKNFFCGLELSKPEQIFFITNVLNSKWDWIYPKNFQSEINNKTFENLAKNPNVSAAHYTRYLNEKFISLGLFSDFWKSADYVNAYFQNHLQSFSAQPIKSDFKMDCVDYKDVLKTNKNDSILFSKLLTKSFENNESVFELVYGTNNYRLLNFISYYCSQNQLNLKKVHTKEFSANKKELMFYIYALARECYAQNSILVVDSQFTNIFLENQEQNSITQLLLTNNNSSNMLDMSEILTKTKTPIIFLSDAPDSKINELVNNLEAQNISTSFSWNLKLPKENKYSYCAERFFASNKEIPLSILGTIVNECKTHKINPLDWHKIVKAFSNANNFSKLEVKSLIRKMFNIKEEAKTKKDSNYVLSALNTSPQISEVAEYIKNAIKIQKNDEKIGCLIKNSGPSGTGKTALVKEVAKECNMPLIIVHASDILSSLSGETEQNIKKIFDNAKETNSILLFDEADTFLHSRGDSLNKFNDFKVNEFLTQMEEFTGILFCNTNLPENFDKATDRRFNFHVEFDYLTKDGFEILFNSYFKNYSISKEQKDELFKSGNFTPGDFGTLYKKLKFVSKEKINSEFICQELISLAKLKNNGFEKTNKIGFSI